MQKIYLLEGVFDLKILGMFNAYFLILVAINGFLAVFVDSRQYKSAKKYGIIIMIIAIALYVVGKWYSIRFK